MSEHTHQKEVIVQLVQQEGIPIVDLAELGTIDPVVVMSVPQELALRHKFVPYLRENGVLYVSMANPFDLQAQEALQAATDNETVFSYTPEEQVTEWLEKLYLQHEMGLYDEASESDTPSSEDGQDGPVVRIDALDDVSEDAPVIRHINKILINAIQERASDIHIEPQQKSVRVRFRIDGALRDVATVPKTMLAAMVSRIKIMSAMDIAERRVPQDGRSKLKIFGRNIDIRISTLPTINGEKVVMRILDKDLHSLDIVDLGLEPELRELFERSLLEPHGMILVTGPTGSGKTTTLYSALNYVNSREKNIITVEDPVEYEMKGINQVQAKPEIGLTFSAGLRAILRQDPDIIMLGEIRDIETAEIAMRSALTGHLVFSTLHTNGSIATLMRLIDMGIDKYLICSSINLVIAQRLVRRICFHCAEEYLPDDKLLIRIPESKRYLEGVTLHHGTGCSHCGNTGYWGRLAIFEFLRLTPQLKEMILKDRTLAEIQAKATESGMESLLTNGFRKIKAGVTTIEEILRVTTDIY